MLKKNIAKSARGDEEHHDVRRSDGAHAEDRQPDERLGRAALDEDERAEQDDREREEAARVQRGPAFLLRLHDPVHERDQPAVTVTAPAMSKLLCACSSRDSGT